MRNKLVLFLLLFSFLEMNASHLIGGEITWECQQNGKYKFTLVIYGECGGVSPSTGNQVISNNAGVPITCSYISTEEIINTCYTGTSSCITYSSAGGQGNIRKYTYQSGDVQLSGTPPASGWHFSWWTCCRPLTLTNVYSPGSTSIWLSSIMYPFTPTGSSTPMNASTCYDSSPQFLGKPRTASSNNTTTRYSQLDFDADSDSLSYEFSSPRGQSGTAISFATGYSASSPTPSSTGNTAASMDPNTGEITFYSSISGSWAIGQKVEEWRCGQKIGEVLKDFVLNTNATTAPSGLCSSAYVSSPPDVAFISLIGPTPVPTVSSSNDTIWNIYCNLNDTIAFQFSSSDAYPNPNCAAQNISFEGSGPILSLDTVYQQDTTIIGATAAKVFSLNTSGGFTHPGNNSVKVGLRIDTTHLRSASSCSSNGWAKYPFKFRFTDDECPIARHNDIWVNVYVNVSTPELPQSNGCIVQNANSNQLNWSPSQDTGTAWGFYLIETINVSGNIIATDTLTNWSDSVFIDLVNFNQAVTYELSVYNASGFSNGDVTIFSSNNGAFTLTSLYYNPPNYITATATGGTEYFWSADKPIFIDNTKNDSVQIALLTDSTTLYIEADNGTTCLYQDSILLRDTSVSICDVYDTTYINVYDTVLVTQIDTVYLTVTDTLIIDVSLIGINPPTFEYQVLVYPNPTNSYLHVEVPQNMIGQSYSMEIKNSIGQSMFGVAMNQPLIQINFNSFGAAGSYTLSIKDSGGNVVDTRVIILQ